MLCVGGGWVGGCGCVHACVRVCGFCEEKKKNTRRIGSIDRSVDLLQEGVRDARDVVLRSAAVARGHHVPRASNFRTIHSPSLQQKKQFFSR